MPSSSRGPQPPLQRHMSDYGPALSFESYGGGGGRGFDGGGGGRRYGYGGSGGGASISPEDWNRRMPQDERLERSEVIMICLPCFHTPGVSWVSISPRV